MVRVIHWPVDDVSCDAARASLPKDCVRECIEDMVSPSPAQKMEDGSI